MRCIQYSLAVVVVVVVVVVTFAAAVTLCVRRISLGGEGNALYPVLSSLFMWHFFLEAFSKSFHVPALIENHLTLQCFACLLVHFAIYEMNAGDRLSVFPNEAHIFS